MSEPDEVFRPEGLQVTVEGETVFIRFSRDDGTQREVALTKSQSSALLMNVIAKIPDANIVPIDRDSLREGKDYQVFGHGVGKTNDGFRLTVFLELLPEKRRVFLRVPMSDDQGRELVANLNHWLARGNEPS